MLTQFLKLQGEETQAKQPPPLSSKFSDLWAKHYKSGDTFCVDRGLPDIYDWSFSGHVMNTLGPGPP